MLESGSYTDRATRVIFYARYEAGHYGSPQIESVHLLLGLAREEWAMVCRLVGQEGSAQSIRKEIEAQITIRERTSTSDKIPFSEECRNILKRAEEEARQRGQGRVDSEHLLVGLLREDMCLATRILKVSSLGYSPRSGKPAHEIPESQKADVRQAIENILDAWDARDATSFSRFFDEGGQFVNGRGELWIGRTDIERAMVSSPASFERNLFGWKIEDLKFLGIDIAVAVVGEGDHKSQETGRLRISFVLNHKSDGWYVLKAHSEEITSAD